MYILARPSASARILDPCASLRENNDAVNMPPAEVQAIFNLTLYGSDVE
jgi:hypothetical protein